MKKIEVGDVLGSEDMGLAVQMKDRLIGREKDSKIFSNVLRDVEDAIRIPSLCGLDFFEVKFFLRKYEKISVKEYSGLKKDVKKKIKKDLGKKECVLVIFVPEDETLDEINKVGRLSKTFGARIDKTLNQMFRVSAVFGIK